LTTERLNHSESPGSETNPAFDWPVLASAGLVSAPKTENTEFEFDWGSEQESRLMEKSSKTTPNVER
jgi:hypothetical protein